MSLPSYYSRIGCLLTATIAALGCSQSDQIHSYTVAKETPQVAADGVATAARPNPAATTSNSQRPGDTANDRMIAAIVPHKDQATFFKVVGPAADVDKVAKEFATFLASMRINEEGGKMTWHLQPTWTQEEGTGMRLATIHIPAEPKPLELTVTQLAWRGTTDDFLNNINRWRGQMQLPPIDAKQLAKETKEIKAGEISITLVDLKGHFQSGMTPPFGGGAPIVDGAAPTQRAGDLTPDANAKSLPPGHPPIAPTADNAELARTEVVQSNAPRFTLPATWKELPAEGMRKAAFSVADGDKQALVTVIEFPASAGPMIADPLENVNRWRREVGLAPVDKNGLATVTESINVGGQDATYMAAIPDAAKRAESQVDRATVAAMVPHSGRIWFIKMIGSPDLVAAEQEHFKEFLKSVRFTADPGAPDGN